MQSEILDILKTLKLRKATGPDDKNNRILIEAAGQLAPQLCDLFNQSLNTSSVPSSWKISKMCPIFKSGDVPLPSNYRPVSSLNNIGKILERIIFKHVYNYQRTTISLQLGNLVSCQVTQPSTKLLVSTITFVKPWMMVWNSVLFFNISKAFHKVWHEGLLFKLKRAGIRGNLLSWFSNYIPNRF